MAEMWKLKCEKCGAEVHLEHGRVQIEPDEYTGELAAAGVLCPFHGGSRYLLRPIATCNRDPSAPYDSHQWGIVGSNAVCLLCDALEHAHNRSASGLEADGRSVFEAGYSVVKALRDHNTQDPPHHAGRHAAREEAIDRLERFEASAEDVLLLEPLGLIAGFAWRETFTDAYASSSGDAG